MVDEEVSGNFGKMVTYSLMSVDDFGAMIFTRATKGKSRASLSGAGRVLSGC